MFSNLIASCGRESSWAVVCAGVVGHLVCIAQQMAELAAVAPLVYRDEAALLIVRQWLDKLADLEG